MDLELDLDDSFSPDVVIWQDREVKFDIPERSLTTRTGEVVIDKIGYVEDTKGNKGMTGRFYITNLRLIWVSSAQQNINLTIGLKCIVQIKARQAMSKLKGQTESVSVLAKFKKNQFEFIFTNLVSDNPRLFSTVTSVHRAYETSKLYRDLRIRGAIVENGSLKLLPLEQLYNKVNGVMNLASDQGVLGVMYITNVRVAWHANANHSFTLSVPYMQMKLAIIRPSKFGAAFVIETLKENASVKLGFRIDPLEKMKETVQEIHRLYMVFSRHPILGVEIHKDTSGFNDDIEEPMQDTERLQLLEEEGNIVTVEDTSDKFAAYFVDSSKHGDRDPMLNPDLGLAMEQLPEGYTLSDLWEVR